MRFLSTALLPMAISFCFGCSSEKPEEITFKEHSITLIALGPEYKEFNKNDTKGFGIHFYYFINLNTDSVFVREKDDLEFPFTTTKNGGIANGISDNPIIKRALKELIKLPEGFARDNSKETCFKSTQRPIFILYKADKFEKHFFYCDILSNSAISDLKEFLFKINDTYNLKEVSKEKYFDEDLILKSIITAEGIDSLYPPVPHVKATIKFIPPVKGYEKDSTISR